MSAARQSRVLLSAVVLLAGIGVAAVAGEAAGRTPTRPNILFLLTDDQQQQTIAALGNPVIQTPNLDKLVREGLVFRNAYCMGGYSAAVCLPSREMIQSGRAWFSSRTITPEAPHFAKTLNEAGYYTFHLGKRGNTPQKLQASYTHDEYLDDVEDRVSGYPCRTLADKVVAFLKEFPRNTGGKPFFMYLAPANPHDPRVAAPEYLARYDAAKIPLPPNFLPFHPFQNGDLLIRDERLAPWPRPEDDIRGQIRDYYAVITAMDQEFGRIFDTLRAIGQYDNTIIIFSSDQGIALGCHGLMGKQNLYEPSMNAGMIFSGPGIPRGQATDAFAYLLDIYPTVCELAGAGVPAGLDGKSLVPILRGQKPSVRDTVFLAYRDVQRAVRQGRWKLIRYPKVDYNQLFDLQADPHETKNLASEPAHAAKVKELLALMAEQQKLFGDEQALVVDQPGPAPVDLEFFRKAPPPAKPKPRKAKAQ